MNKRNDNAKSPRVIIALCGNPNCGKTTLFNRITKSNQKVGNWSGVTVERKEGRYANDSSVAIVDTPGVYSLTPYALDEKITADYLQSGQPSAVINVVDATNLQRNLLLTSQLLDLNIPVVVALNFKDEAANKGIVINSEKLEKQLGCKCFYISAAKNDGIDELMRYCAESNFIRASRSSSKRFKDLKQRYDFIQSAISACVTYTDAPNTQSKTTKAIDKVALNKFLAFPLFFAVMTLIFYLSIGSLGKWLTAAINDFATPLLQRAADYVMQSADSKLLTSLVTDGIIGGVMSVASFTPQIMILFGLISLLEASGYMARIALITDRLLGKIGLGGRSFVSMILGFGCSVPAIMSTRTIKNVRERNVTITLTPFTPCSAKLAIISFFTANAFDGNALVAIAFYALSMTTVVLGGLAFKIFNRRKADVSDAFVMELPDYRAPTLTNVLKQMGERGKSFLLKAGTVIFASSVILWIAQNFDFALKNVSPDKGMLAQIGKLIAPVFMPLGFDDGGCGWQFSVAALTGITAKETVVTTLEILLPTNIGDCISTLGAFSFVAYNLLTAPCVAAISASFSEQGFSAGIKSLIFQIATAYCVSALIYQAGKFAAMRADVVIIIMIAITASLAIVAAIKFRVVCANCRRCAKCRRDKR